MNQPRALVLDSSVMVKWLSQVDEEHVEQARAVLRDIQAGVCTAYAPELSKYEIGNVLLKGKKLEPEQAERALRVFYQLPVHLVAETPEITIQTYALAYEHGLTYYDATFLSVAQILQCEIVTDNVKHQGKATNIPVIPLATYTARKKRSKGA